MGFKVSGIVDMGRPLFGSPSIGNVIAFFKANIDKCYFDNWLNIAELQAKFPTRIQTNGSMVSFTGPVAILSSIKALTVSLSVLTGLGSLFLTYYASSALLNLLKDHKVSVIKDLDEDTIFKVSTAVAVVVGLAAAGLFYTFAPLPTQPGVYFLN